MTMQIALIVNGEPRVLAAPASVAAVVAVSRGGRRLVIGHQGMCREAVQREHGWQVLNCAGRRGRRVSRVDDVDGSGMRGDCARTLGLRRLRGNPRRDAARVHSGLLIPHPRCTPVIACRARRADDVKRPVYGGGGR